MGGSDDATRITPPLSIPGWATFSPGGGPGEAGQSATYTVSNVSNPGLFSAGPAVDGSGTLTYTLAANANGTSTYDVYVRDDGGTANGGVDTPGLQPFTIPAAEVNDAPSFPAVDPPAN